ncbi:hypothetical protein A7E78_10590 [Syntrophotalea acetylenivorans]|uniref:SprT-like domain-containing protein n=1 Tax=Syntrophotalea acetylenivorans TaxID=1842532 RepID=A0A1L3GQR5_9BACT|nr:SprT-like domain-containing protein [Syntrophotalea acetylenivorans]APG28255.1 hypothetical protein A7E78_10590 [Syntrophotalea acetylenivorans]
MHNDSMSKQKSNPRSIGATVSFQYRERELSGVIARLTGQAAFVLGNDQCSYRIPIDQLQSPCAEPVAIAAEAATAPVPSAATLQVNEEITFHCRGQQLSGRIVRLNPRRAHVLCENNEEYAVPYARIAAKCPQSRNDVGERLSTVRQLAVDLLDKHGLAGWSFDFDHAVRRAGCCDYRRKRISLALQFVRQVSEEEIHDTLLHEIAHALVGKKHNHDAVWKAKAQAIGSSGERCHDTRFCPPRYIVACRNGCWRVTAERRRRNVVCGQCRGEIVYQTFTEKRWRESRDSKDHR